MWTLWLVSELLQRLSLRNQSSYCIPAILTVSLVWNTNSLPQGGKATGYRAATFFPRRPPLPILFLTLMKIFLQRETSKCIWGYASHPQWESDQSRGLHFTCPNPQTSLNSTGCFSAAAARQSLPLSVTCGHQPNTSCEVNSAKKKIRDRKEGETGLMEGRILPHCVGDDDAKAAWRCTCVCFLRSGWVLCAFPSFESACWLETTRPLHFIFSRRVCWPSNEALSDLQTSIGRRAPTSPETGLPCVAQ